MKITNYEKVSSQSVDMEGASGCRVRWLVGENDNAPNFAMRQFEVAPSGHTPRHSHPYEHEIFVLEGEGVALEGDEPRPIAAGDVIFVRPGEIHQFRNTSNVPLKFLCLVPNSASSGKVTVAPECGVESDPR